MSLPARPRLTLPRPPLGLAPRLALWAAGMLATFAAVGLTAAHIAAHVQTQWDADRLAGGLVAALGPELLAARQAGDTAAEAEILDRLRALPAVKDAAVLGAGAGPPLADGVVVAALGLGADTPWRLHLALDRDMLLKRHALVWWMLASTLLTLLVIAAPLYWLAVRRALAPMRQLTAFAEQVTSNKLSQTIDIRTGDEFQTLGAAFNTMIGRLDQSLKRIQRLAFVDPVTDLPNAERFHHAVRQAIGAATPADVSGAVVLLRFERLGQVIETIGEDAGQELIGQLAQLVTSHVHRIDRLVRRERAGQSPAHLARLKGTDFAVLVRDLAEPSDAARYAQMLSTAFSQPFEWREHKLALGCLCGVALFPRDGRDVDTLMRHANVALGAARTAQEGLKFFTKSLDRAAIGKLTLEREMRGALEANQFRAYFQPKINLRSGAIEGAEALARWVRPDGSIVSPGKFIPAAEENGLIIPISEAILREAVWKAAAWAREGLAIRVSVNVSPLQLRDSKFPQRVLSILRQAGLPAFCLELEITESIALEDPERAHGLIEVLREQGVRISIDDFGCGHSNLAALTRLPFDVVKIDQQFVRSLNKERQAPALIDAILALARAMDLDVVAEGVETEEAAAFLRRRGCGYAQGFLFGAAVTPAEFGRILRRADAEAEGRAGAA